MSASARQALGLLRAVRPSGVASIRLGRPARAFLVLVVHMVGSAVGDAAGLRRKDALVSLAWRRRVDPCWQSLENSHGWLPPLKLAR